MGPRTKARHGDHKSPSTSAVYSDGHGRASGSGSKSGREKGRQHGGTQDETAVMRPWANQPWPLIEMPSKTQHITHPALHIANEIALIHNAMIRGLNSIYLQAPHVEQPQDVADLLFLTQSWSVWVLDHHGLKEGTMLPGFEAALGVPMGTLVLPLNRSPSAASFCLDGDEAVENDNEKDKDVDREDEDTISFLLHRVYAYASAAHGDPQTYNATTLEELLIALANRLVPHLTGQVKLLASMREMCSGTTATKAANGLGEDATPGPLPIPMVTITRTASKISPSSSASASASASPLVSPSSSTFSSASASSTTVSSPAHSPTITPSSLSLFPSTPRSSANNANDKSGRKHGPTPPTATEARDMVVIDTVAKDRLARARALLEADDRANKLTKAYLSADARASASMDRFVVLPMIVRLRDSTATTTNAPMPMPMPAPPTTASTPAAPPPTPSALSRRASYSSLNSSYSASTNGTHSGWRTSTSSGMMTGFGSGGAGAAEWPRLSIPAVHAIADKLSPKHEGAWRFLPCDVWGRPRELQFLG